MSNNKLELVQLRTLEQAIHEVCEENEIGLYQMKEEMFGAVRAPQADHVYSIGDAVLMIGSHLSDPRQHNKALGLETQIAQRTALLLGLGMDDPRIQIQCDLHNGMFRTRMTRLRPRVVTWKEIAQQAGDAIVLGRDQETMNLVTVNMLEWVPGAKVTGASRIAGKSNLLRLLVAQAAGKGWRIYLACMKGNDGWEDLIPLATGGVAFDNEAGAALLESIREEVYARNAGKKDKHPPMLLVWDEASTFVTKKDNQARLGELASVAGSAHFVLLVGVQTLGQNVEKVVHENLTTSIVGKTATANASYTNSNVKQLGAHLLAGKGHFYYVQNNGTIQEVQVPRADSRRQRIDALAKDYNVPASEVERWITAGRLREADVASDIGDLIEQAYKALGLSRNGAGPERPDTDAPKGEQDEWTPKTLRNFYMEMVRAEKETDGRRVPPDMELCGKAVSWAMRFGQIPTYRQIQKWVRERPDKSKTIHNRRIEVIRNLVKEYYMYVIDCIQEKRLSRFEVGGIFAADFPSEPAPLEASQTHVPLQPYASVTIGKRYLIEFKGGNDSGNTQFDVG